MEKIATLFDRDWDGHRGVIPKLSETAARVLGAGYIDDWVATEKLDGTNIRITVRRGTAEVASVGPHIVRVEKRRNPDKAQKRLGISEPWYTDTSPGDPADQHLLEAAANVSALYLIPDGEHACEAVGPKIQGNPLDLADHLAVPLFVGGHHSVPRLAEFELSLQSVPAASFRYVQGYFETARSALNPDRPIEGIVWHHPVWGALKIKAKDYR